jgi:hypothetical protein
VLAFAAFDEEGAALSRSLTREHFTGARAGLLFTIVHEWYRVNQAPMEPAILESRWIEAGRSAMEATELDSALHSAWTNVAGQDVPKIVKELARSVRRRKYNSLLVQARIALTPPLREPLKALSLIEQANKVANDNAAGSDAAALITLHGAESIFKPLPEMKWISSELMLGLGRPALVAAYGGTGKTLLLQALALCVAAGNSIWNKYAIAAPLSVVHLDYEQGSWATYRRYQRLALGYGISPAEIGDRLQVASHPPLYLTSKKAADELQRISEGRHLVIIDSLRAGAPGVD